jgi:hypothetical protein
MNKRIKVCREIYSKPEYFTPDEVDGQLLSSLPSRVNSIDLSKDLIFATLDLNELKTGKEFIDIKHHTDARNRHRNYYSTSITNRIQESIRIDRFASYIKTGSVFIMHTTTGGFYSAQQFREWYDLDGLTIAPGQTVTDPNNHGKVGNYWVYFGTTESGQQFVSGSQWMGKPWWQII